MAYPRSFPAVRRMPRPTTSAPAAPPAARPAVAISAWLAPRPYEYRTHGIHQDPIIRQADHLGPPLPVPNGETPRFGWPERSWGPEVRLLATPAPGSRSARVPKTFPRHR